MIFQLDIIDTNKKLKNICEEYDVPLTSTNFKENSIEIAASNTAINILIDLNINFEDMPSNR